jgi:Ca2+-transporting ATPase
MKMGGYKIANTMLFTTIVLYAFVRVAVIRVEEDIPIFINKWVNLAILASFLLQLFVLYTPVNKFFGVVPPGLREWGIMFAFTIISWYTGVWLARLVIKRVPV